MTDARAASLLDDAPCALVAFADDGTVVAANRALTSLLHVESAAVVGQPLEQLLTLPSRIFYQTHLFPLLTLHGRADELYLTLRAADGSSLPVLANAVRREQDGAATSTLAMLPMRLRREFEDQLLAARRAAEAANRAKSAFLSVMSHELRTPLNSIIGFSRLVHRRAADRLGPDLSNYLERVEANGAHLLSVVNGVLDLSRIEAGKVETVIAPADVGALVRDVVASLEGQSRPAQVALVVDVPAGPALAMVDETKLRQVLINLVGNAIKFTSHGSVTATVSCNTDGSARSIAVRDTGIGIPPHRLHAIFEPFEQGERSTSRRYGGTGLGLPIARSLCHMFEAELTVDSVRGAGSCFTVTLGTPRPTCISPDHLSARA